MNNTTMNNIDNDKYYSCVKCRHTKHISEFYIRNSKIVKSCKICTRELVRKNRLRKKLISHQEYNENITKKLNISIKNGNTKRYNSIFNCSIDEIIEHLDHKINNQSEYNWDNFGTVWEADIITLSGCVYRDKKLVKCDYKNIFPSNIILNEYIKQNC